MKKAFLLFMVFAIAISVTLIGVSTGVAAEGRRFGFVFPGIHQFWEPVSEAAISIGRENGWVVTTAAPDTSDASRQIEIIENMVAAGLDAIAITPLDEAALRGVIDRLVDDGIVVVCLESDSPDSNRMAYIGTNNYKAGRHMGSVIARDLEGSGEILILTGLPTQPSLVQRVDGIRDYLAEKAPDITILQITSHEGNVTKAVSDTENMVEANPGFDAIIGIDANTGPAFMNVWRQKGWTGADKMIIVFDDVPDNLRGLQDGYVKSIVSQRELIWAQDTLDLMNALLDGKEVPDYTDTGTVEITLDNLDSYMEDPFWEEED